VKEKERERVQNFLDFDKLHVELKKNPDDLALFN
jgi:hypothetical protein